LLRKTRHRLHLTCILRGNPENSSHFRQIMLLGGQDDDRQQKKQTTDRQT